MPTFGQHDSARRLHTSGVGSLHTLKSDPDKLIKVLQPPEGIWSDQQLREEIDAFLLKAKTQRLLAKSSKHWAPVHQVSALRQGTEGSQGGGDALDSKASAVTRGEYKASGAFALLDRYQRTAQSLIDGHVQLTNDDLRTLVSGVLQGLIDIRATARRPHGNLKPANILLANAALLPNATVHLADPAPDGALSKSADAKDHADLAKIIFHLVHLRPYLDGTLGRTPEWDRLGPHGEDWRKLAAALLDPAAPADHRDFAKLLPKIATWTQKPKKSKKPMAIAASILFFFIAGGVALWFFTRPPQIDFDPPRWEKLCLAYHAWFGDFADHLADDSTKRKFSAPPYPADVLKILSDAAKDLDHADPKKIARRPSAYTDLAQSPTDDAKLGSGPWYTKQGAELIDRVAATFTPDHWPALKTLDTAAKTYTDRGWQKPAAGLRNLLASARPPELPLTPADIAARAKLVRPTDFYADVDAAVLATRAVADIDARWARIQEQLKKLPTLGDGAQSVPLLAALPRFAEEFPRSQADAKNDAGLGDVTSLAATVTQIESVATQLLADLTKPNQQILFAELAKDPGVQLPPTPLTLDTFASLPAITHGYIKLATDPRAATDWQKSLADIDTNFIKLIPVKANDPHLPALIQQRTDLQEKVTAWASVAPIEKNSATLATLVSGANADLALLNKNAREWVAPYIIDPPVYIAKQEARLTTSPLAKLTPALYAEWKKHHTDLLTRVKAAPNDLKSYDTYTTINSKFETLEKTYLDFDAKIPPAVPGLADIKGGGGDTWRTPIAARVATVYREAALTDIATNPALTWADDVPQIDAPAYLSYQKNRLNQYDTLRTDTLALIADYSAITDRLDHLHLLPDEPIKAAPTWRDLFAKWQKHLLLTDASIAAALKPITDRVTALLAIDAITDYQPLLAQITATAPPELLLTAWRKLGTAPLAESTPALADEDQAEAALTQTLSALATNQTITPQQRSAFAAEIAAQRPVRWHRWADTLASPAAIQTALDRLEAFNVSLSPQTDAPMIYNQKLYALRKQFDKNLKDADLKPLAKTFTEDVKALPDPVSKNKDILQLLTLMEKPLTSTEEDSSTAGAGPKLAGWEQDVPVTNPNMRLYYFPNKTAPRYILSFIKIPVAEFGTQKNIYIATTEMPLGLFADAVDGELLADKKSRFPDLDNTGKPGKLAHYIKVPVTESDKNWSDAGARAWSLTGKKFAPNNTWIYVSAAKMQGKSPYPDVPPPPPLPTADYPMQNLSPWTAMYVARLLGCRLPTSDEWTAAYNRAERPAPNRALAKDVWNLRGEAPPTRPSWRTQQDFAQKMSADGLTFPDKGIYLPSELLFEKITAENAKPWTAAALNKLNPDRITPSADAYQGSTLWFRPVGSQPNTPSPYSSAATFHDLVGNVAEYTFDTPKALDVIKDNTASTSAIDAAVTAAKRSLFVIGGSSLSPPEIPFDKKQEVDLSVAQTDTGYADVGFRLAFTAPIDSISDILATHFKDPKYLPGPKASQ